MAFDQADPGIPTPNINPQPTAGAMPASPTEQQVRTMRSDVGGIAPPGPAPVSGLPTFDAEEPTFTPETTDQSPAMAVPSQGGKKMPWVLIGSIGGFIVLALVGYFVIYPMFGGSEPYSTPETPVTPVAPVPPAAPVVHKTQFINPPAGTVTEQLTGAATKELVNGAMVKTGQTAKAGITEIVLLDPAGNPVNIQSVLTALSPTIAAADVPATAAPADNLTAFIYKDTAGVWPGYVGELQAGATAEQISALTRKLEQGTLKNFFVVDPGTVAAFKDGTIGTLPDRYAAGSTQGASFGYLVTKNKLLISTSFQGMKEALRLMGL